MRRPDLTLAVADHNVPTDDRCAGVASILDPDSRLQVETLERNVRDFGVRYVPLTSRRQGIVHVIGPEMGLTLPGALIVCGDSHTSTHGAFGALAFGIGTSEVEHVLATQTVVQSPSSTFLIRIDGRLHEGVSAKDLILKIIADIGAGGATGYVVEYAGEAIRVMGMAGRMTLCNMTIEAGARAGLIAPDDTTFAWLAETPFAPKGKVFEAAKIAWRALASDPGAAYDRVLEIDAGTVEPMVTWGTSPEDAAPIGGVAPEPAMQADAGLRAQMQRRLDYMGLTPGTPAPRPAHRRGLHRQLHQQPD